MSKTAVVPFRLNFSTKVLGEKAAERLRNQKVSQSIRSQSSTIVDEMLHNRVRVKDTIEIALDDILVGLAELGSVDRVTWDRMTQDDAERGGFDTTGEQQNALLRAGYRFKPIQYYQFYRIQFEWVKYA